MTLPIMVDGRRDDGQPVLAFLYPPDIEPARPMQMVRFCGRMVLITHAEEVVLVTSTAYVHRRGQADPWREPAL